MTRTSALLAGACAALLAAPASLAAQATPAAPAAGDTTVAVAASGRATAAFAVNTRVGRAQPTAKLVTIDYGQPHARGRAVAGGLIPYGEVWRTGANTSTTLTSAVDLEIGGQRVPAGTYSLYSLLTRDGWSLIINRNTGQWGTEYDQARDLARVPMTVRTRAEPAESFTITFVPSTATPMTGALVLAWGTVEGSVNWRVVR